MKVKTGRLSLILMVIFITSIYLPFYYWTATKPRIIPPRIYYSPVKDDFIIGHYTDSSYFYTDLQGNHFNRSAADTLMPLLNYRVLASRGRMPDIIAGVKIDLQNVYINNIIERIRPKDLERPAVGIYPLLETKPARLRLTLPHTFFRIKKRMEFINARTNKIDEQESTRYTNLLKKKGFTFPATMIFGNPSTRKPIDEGYLVVDARQQLFHIKKVHGHPYCKNIPVPEGVRIKWIYISERELQEYYAIILSEKNEIYLLLHDHYRFRKLPVHDYIPEKQTLMFGGTMLYRLLTLRETGHSKAYLMNRNYELKKVHEERWPTVQQSTAGIVARYLFPFKINIASSKHYYLNLYFSGYHFEALILGALLMLLTMLILKKREKRILKYWPDLLIVLITGLYGFIAVLIYENTDV